MSITDASFWDGAEALDTSHAQDPSSVLPLRFRYRENTMKSDPRVLHRISGQAAHKVAR